MLRKRLHTQLRIHHWRKKEGIALVIVLAFIVLLTGLVVAFFSRTLSERLQSNSSAAQAQADVLADGAVNTIIGDLRNEIAAGSDVEVSSSTNMFLPEKNATGPFLPNSSQTFVPYRIPFNGPPNLIKESLRSTPFYANDHGGTYDTTNFPPANRASTVLTTAQSQNGRYVSLARWNRALLLPKLDTSSTNDGDFTPTPDFQTPNWVVVDGTGNAIGSAGDPNRTMNSSYQTAVGRYAYAIYNEGGLLDVNIAGYPIYTPTDPTTLAISSSKISPAYADLTTILTSATVGLSATPSPGSLQTPGAPDVVNDLVGWRNFATVTPTIPSNNFPGYTFSGTTAISTYNQMLLSDTSGMLQTSGNGLTANQGDQRFNSRQQLIQFLLGGVAPGGASGQSLRVKLETALQFLGTFGRDLNQPSYVPDPGRPLVKGLAAGGNDLGGLNTDPTSSAPTSLGANDAVNPPFSKVLVTQKFTRNSGITAQAGDHLVVSRFPLNRLAWITYLGPSAGRGGGNTTTNADIQTLLNSGIPQAYLNQGTATNIYAYFGLQWNPGSRNWTYGHPSSSAILTLTDANGQTGGLTGLREPDFVELLKASIAAGSLAKAATGIFPESPAGTFMAWQGLRDQKLDYAIIQLFANIIDEADADGYPTTIVFDNHQFHGCESVPYFYRVRTSAAIARMPIPMPNTSGTFINPETGTIVSGSAGDPEPATATTKITQAGVAISWQQPEIWNPYAWKGNVMTPTGSPSTSAADLAAVNASMGNPRPTSFRISATNAIPDSGGSTVSTVALAAYQDKAAGKLWTTTGTPLPLNLTATQLVFNVPTSRPDLFREPTMLTRPGIPNGGGTTIPGSNLACLAGNSISNINAATATVANGLSTPVSSSVDNVLPIQAGNYYGVVLAAVPIRYIKSLNLPPGAGVSGTAIFTISSVLANQPGTLGVDRPSLVYRMEYQAVNGSWITYDEKYGSPVTDVGGFQWQNSGFYPNWPSTAPTMANTRSAASVAEEIFDPNAIFNTQGVFSYVDPRTSRFSMAGSIMDTWGTQPRSAPDFAWQEGVNALYFPPGVGYNDYVSVAQTPNPDFEIWWAENEFVSNRPGPMVGEGTLQGSTLPSPAGMGVILSNTDTTVQMDTMPRPELGFHPGWKTGANLSENPTSPANINALRAGLFVQNNMNVPNDGIRGMVGDSARFNGGGGAASAQYYEDADATNPGGAGIVRRASAAYVPFDATHSALSSVGQPMATATVVNASTSLHETGTETTQAQSRPIMLNRPFQSVAELGCVFSGTPWKNIDFFTPESGDSALLDVFCINDNQLDPAGSPTTIGGTAPTPPANFSVQNLVAGKVDLNTRQPLVLQAILNGAAKDAWNPGTSGLTPNESAMMANLLVARTTGTNSQLPNTGPLRNVAELVGKFVSGYPNGYNVATNPTGTGQPYDGFSGDLDTTKKVANVTPAGFPWVDQFTTANGQPALTGASNNIQRYREVAVRALSASGQTRFWNVMIDVIAQTGKYPPGANTGANFPANFIVQGESRFWVHAAIDRYTGGVADKSVEIVKE